MKSISPILFSVVLLFATCCKGDAPRIDGTNADSFAASVEKVTESVPAGAAQEEFLAIFALVAAEEIRIDEEDPDGKLVNGRLAKKLHGMTATEIVAKYKPLLEKARKSAGL